MANQPRNSMKIGNNIANQIEDGYKSNVGGNAPVGSFRNKRANKLTNFLPESRGGKRPDSTSESYNGDCQEEEEEEGNEETDSMIEKGSTVPTPYQTNEAHQKAQGSRIRPILPMSNKSTAGSSSLKSNYSSQYRGVRGEVAANAHI